MSVNFYAVTLDHAAAGEQGLHIGQSAARCQRALPFAGPFRARIGQLGRLVDLSSAS
ncbi:hypothetical protein [Streptomyces sp. 3211]|uniref:hypothetical protein n=1 Tax=Streptomyces sp. 3211 TaxID=1964449 RepID=UPI00133131A6|nr:hypothetical protein [Streptomyces sp. 3211]